MTPQHLNTQELLEVLNLARLAPSAHNTQPWKVQFADDTLTVRIDWDHALGAGDPSKRQLYISLGIFTEALQIAFKHFGYSSTEPTLQKDHIELNLTKQDAHTHDMSTLVQALRHRTTDRSSYAKIAIPPEHITKLKECSPQLSSTIWAITDQATIADLAKKTSKAIGVAISSPAFRNELSELLVQPWSKQDRGISVRSLYIPLPIEVSEPFILKHGIALSLEPRLEYKRWASSSGIVFITTPGDLHDDWFTTGRTYLQTCLLLETMGYSQATSAALVEASTFHEDVEELLETRERLQAVIRFGKGKKQRFHSPRVEAAAILES